MSTATNEVLEVANLKNLDLRTAAYVLALNKLNEYYTTRGIDIWFIIFIDQPIVLIIWIKALKIFTW